MTPFWYSLAGIILGQWFLRIGLRRCVVREGDDPRCAQCGYILRGISSARCPECGADVKANTIYGIVRRNRPLMVLGCIGVIAGMMGFRHCWDAPLYTDFWYGHAPTFVLLRQAEYSQYSRGAWAAISKRAKAGELTGATARDVYKAAMANVTASNAAVPLFLPPQQNLWATSGSGRWPKA